MDWDSLLKVASASPFTGTHMSLVTALLGLVMLQLLRRLLPADQRHHGRVSAIFLVIALALGLVRLALQMLGFGASMAVHVLGLLTTFLVATGAVSTLILLAFEVVPTRAGLRFSPIFREVIQALAMIVIAFGVLAQSGIEVVPLITTSAVLTAIIGLALQSTMTNLFAGLTLHADRALEVGDWLQVGARTGRVREIRWRSTLLGTTDGDLLILPNNQLVSQEVYNLSRPAAPTRLSVRAGFHFRHAPNEVKAVLVAMAKATPGVLAKPAPDCLPEAFGEYAITYALRFWIEDYARKSEVTGEVMTRLWYAARRAGFEIPYPIQTEIRARHSELEAPGERDHDERLNALERIDLFAPLERTEKEMLASGMTRLIFAAGEPVLRQGEAGDSLYVIARGRIAIAMRKDGIEQEVAALGPGEFFGEMSLMTGAPRAATCTAVTDTLCYVIDRAGFQSVVTLRPRLADELSTRLEARQTALAKMGDEMAAIAARAPEVRKDLLSKIRSFFDLAP